MALNPGISRPFIPVRGSIRGSWLPADRSKWFRANLLK